MSDFVIHASDESFQAVSSRRNVDDNASLAVQFCIQSIPKLIFFKGGQEVVKAVGAPPKPRLVQEIVEVLSD